MGKRVVLSASILLSLVVTTSRVTAAVKVTGRTARGNVQVAIEPADDSKGVRVLIEMDARPGDRAAAVARAADLDRDLHRIDAQFRSASTSRTHVAAESLAPHLGQIYTHVFQGVSATVPTSELAALRALPYVRGIHADTTYEATTIDGVGVVKAPQIWTSLSIRGKGIVAAVIDTGIDYRHAAFGGSFGPGQKVAGGYDFVDNDNDPMDENGHGTHVAGILAGNGGGVTGVAPEATLMAYRVLDRTGRGVESDVMAAIERAIDPNQDGDTKDHVDVINLSLGGPGNSDDLLSHAVDAASAAGVVVCVAAGNAGLDIGTVTSPGNARTAITVGATGQIAVFFGGGAQLHNSRAYFSSRGPVGRMLDFKPDVMAPGVSIASAKLGGGTIEMSGTSMATPLVAGVAALLKLIHPAWTPADIKAAMVSTAGADLPPGGAEGGNIGGGLVDAVAAANAAILPSPAQLSFGVGGSSPTTRTLSLRLTNRGSRRESLAVNGATDFEKSVNVQPASFTLDPGQTIDLSVTLSIGPASTGAPADLPGGFLRFEGSTSLHVPFAAVQGAAVTVQYAPEKEFLVWPLEQGRLVQPDISFPPRVVQGGGESTLLLGVDQYDLLLLDEDGRLLVAEGKTANGASTVVLSPSDAGNAIASTFVDELGLPLEPDVTLRRYCSDHLTVFVPGSSVESPMYVDIAAAPGALPPLQASAMSSRFTLFRSRGCFDFAQQAVHAVVLDPLAGVRSSVALSNSPSAWLGSAARFFFEPSHVNRQVRLGARLHIDHDDEFRDGSLTFNGSAATAPLGSDDSSMKFSLFVAQGSSKSVSYDAFLEAQAQPPGEPLTQLTVGPYVTIQDGQLAVAPTYGTNDLTFVPVENELQLNDGPVHARRFSAPDGLADGMLTLQTQWFGPLHENRYYESVDAQTKLFGPDGNEVAPAGPVDFIWLYFLRANLQPGPYRVVSVDSHYRTAGMPGRATSTATFDTRNADITDPEISALRVLNGKGETRSRIPLGDTAQIVFSMADYELACEPPACNNQVGRYDPVRADATKLWVRPHDSAVWNQMSVRVTGGAMESVIGKLSQALPGGIEFRSEMKLPAGYYDMKIHGEDRNGNQTELTIEPAFAVDSGIRPHAVLH